MAFRVAKELGYFDVDAMLANAPASMLVQWVAYFGLEPFGEERADLRAGIVSSVVANCNRAKGGKAFEPKDFMPKFGKRKRATRQSMIATLKAIAGVANQING